ncbi:MAG TPA: alpha/beta fold hydrolase [Vicinamibacterales bacterium]|jgi:predicted peptidase|nr:alpha/beta fold hydrolase [Vicinamibacterales bacterium]
MNIRDVVAACVLTIAAVPAYAQGPGQTPAQEWVQPERSKANVEALARVQVKHYKLPTGSAPEATGTIDMEYRLYVPTKYDTSRPNPLVIALHGLGSGTSYMMEYSNLVELAEQYGYIVATPMGYNESGWYGARGQGNEFNRRAADPGPANLGALSELDVLDVLKTVRGDYNVDPHRIYLIGQSMGGGGTLYIGSKYPDTWAALAAMAPAIYISPDTIAGAQKLPVMVVQGDADTQVNPAVTRSWVAKMKELGMKYEYIEVPGGTHNSAGRLNIDKVFAFIDKQRKP